MINCSLIFVVQGIVLKAWIDVTSGKDSYARKAGKYFDEGLKEGANVFALMGKVMCVLQLYSEQPWFEMPGCYISDTYNCMFCINDCPRP